MNTPKVKTQLIVLAYVEVIIFLCFSRKTSLVHQAQKVTLQAGSEKKNDLEGNTILIMPGPEPILLSFCTLVARFYIILYTCKLQQKLPWLSSLLQVGKHYICPARETSPP